MARLHACTACCDPYPRLLAWTHALGHACHVSAFIFVLMYACPGANGHVPDLSSTTRIQPFEVQQTPDMQSELNAWLGLRGTGAMRRSPSGFCIYLRATGDASLAIVSRKRLISR